MATRQAGGATGGAINEKTRPCDNEAQGPKSAHGRAASESHRRRPPETRPISPSRWSSKPRPQKCSGSSRARRPSLSRFLRPYWRTRHGFARPTLATCICIRMARSRQWPSTARRQLTPTFVTANPWFGRALEAASTWSPAPSKSTISLTSLPIRRTLSIRSSFSVELAPSCAFPC